MNNKGEITVKSFGFGLLIFCAIALALTGVYYDTSQNYNITIDRDFAPIYEDINTSLRGLYGNTTSAEQTAQLAEEDSGVSDKVFAATKTVIKVGKLPFTIVKIIYTLIAKVISIMGMPEWVSIVVMLAIGMALIWAFIALLSGGKV